ncbi:hypothetical protein PWV83_004518 [Escherichia coli]|nr:hypothetical protein [Escherichia coli]
MKHLSPRAATADNNRIVTIEDVYTIAFSQPIHTESALGQRWMLIHTGEYESASDAKRFLDPLAIGHCACMVTPSPVLEHDTWLHIRLLMGEIRDAK